VAESYAAGDRYDVHSILITSQLPIERWYEIIGHRIIHNACRIELKGESMRKLKAANSPSPTPTSP